jgi:hypothetical protein
MVISRAGSGRFLMQTDLTKAKIFLQYAKKFIHIAQ